VRDLIFTVTFVEIMGHMKLMIVYFNGENIKEDRWNKKEKKGKNLEPVKGKASGSSHYIVSHFNIGVTKYLFNTSFPSCRYP
jgi:hypothetical protein